MRGFRILLAKELLEQWRTSRLLVVVGTLAIVGILSPLLARFTPELVTALGGAQFLGLIPPPSVGDSVDQFLKNLLQFGAIVAILLSMGAVAPEVERGSAGFVLTKPASRAAFLAAKLVALGLLLALGVAAAGVCTYLYTAVLFEPLDAAGFVGTCLLVWLSLAAAAAITFFGSTLTTSSLVAAGLGVVALIGGGVLAVFPAIGPYVPASLAGPARALALGRDPGNVVGPAAVSVGILALALVGAWLVFRRREL